MMGKPHSIPWFIICFLEIPWFINLHHRSSFSHWKLPKLVVHSSKSNVNPPFFLTFCASPENPSLGVNPAPDEGWWDHRGKIAVLGKELLIHFRSEEMEQIWKKYWKKLSVPKYCGQIMANLWSLAQPWRYGRPIPQFLSHRLRLFGTRQSQGRVKGISSTQHRFKPGTRSTGNSGCHELIFTFRSFWLVPRSLTPKFLRSLTPKITPTHFRHHLRRKTSDYL